MRYRGRVYSYLRTRLNNDEDAADATQQVFLQALKALPKYKQRGKPFAVWLFRIAHHLAINLSSRNPSTVSWQALPEHPASEQDVEANVLQQETLAHLRRLLATLDPYKRELLSLRFAAGLTVPQIAAVLGKNPEAIKKQLSRLLQSFKEQYHDEQ
jgi:RNA polymerase sigma-70 factor (ECF subfamily)